MRDTTATYQRLQAIILQPGCPICGLCQEAVTTYLDTMLWESSTDINANAMFVASLGFCGRHSRALLDFGGQRLAAAVVERAALLAAIRRLPELTAATLPAGSRSWRWPSRPQVKVQPAEHANLSDAIATCPACVRQAAEEARGIEVLLQHLDEFVAPLTAAGGLCLPHFVRSVGAATAAQRETLLTVEQQVWTDLAANLEEFIDRHKGHRHGEPISDPARLAVERTIASLTGEYPVR